MSIKPEEFSFADYGVVKGAILDVTFRTPGLWPKQCRCAVEKVYLRFALLKTKHYRVTIHYIDLLIGAVKVGLAQGPEVSQRVIWLPESWERVKPSGKMAVKK